MLTGCLRNAAAVATAARQLAGPRPIGVIAAGERWPDGSLRPATEDLLGAGTIFDPLNVPLSVEARIARDAFWEARVDLADVLADSMSGRELIDHGFRDDVQLTSKLDISRTIPLLRDGT